MLKLTSVNLKKEHTRTLIIPVCEDKTIHENKTILALIARAREQAAFKGAKGDDVRFYAPPEIKADQVTFLGLGSFGGISAESFRELAGTAVKKCIQMERTDLHLMVPPARKTGMETAVLLTALLEGACLGNHIFDRYKKEKKETPLTQITLVAPPAVVRDFDGLPARVATVCRGTILAREWVTIPANDKKPAQFSRLISEAAAKTGLNVNVLDEKTLRRKKFGALLAVGAGSTNRPRLLVLEHKPKGAKKTVALVGKGVTFDSGGINLKSSSGLDGMKMDMAGAAAVAATLITASRLNLDVHLVGVMPLVENMPSGDATRPGDIVRTFAGNTVEIGNTDAEGRLILVDAMAWAVKTYAPDVMVDLATLTGACVVALGERLAGVFSSDPTLAASLVQAGTTTGERCWHLPLPEDYREYLKSDVADLNNISSSRWGGAITAALFLSEFTKDTAWAHIDIAGPATLKKPTAYCGAGGTGYGVRLLCDWLANSKQG